MSQKVRIALTLDLENPIHKKAYALLSKLNRAHSEFIAYLTSNFIDSNYGRDISNISKADAKILALCAKCCCNDSMIDFTADPKILGQLVMLLNQNALINGSDVDIVIRKALANINVFTGQADHTTISGQDNTSLPVTNLPPTVSKEHERSVESHDFNTLCEPNLDSNDSVQDSSDPSISEDESSDIEPNNEDVDSDDMPIEINEAALQAFNSML